MVDSVAVTGAAGRLGRRLVARLLSDEGIRRVVAIDRAPLEPTDPRMVVVRADVRDPDLAPRLRGCQALCHLAFVVEKGGRDPERVRSINLGGTRNVCQAAHRAGLDQVVYASSIAAYGFHPSNREGPLTEEAPLRGNPEFYYTRSKARVEAWLDGFEADHPGMAICRLRPSMFLDREHAGDLPTLRLPFWPYLPGGEDVPAHLTHAADVVQAFRRALEHGASGAYNVAAADPLPMAEWGRVVGRSPIPLPGAAVELQEVAYRLGLTDVSADWYRWATREPIVVSTEKIRRELDWTPRYPTTADVLRAVSGRATAEASRATRLVLGSACWRTRLLGDLGLSSQESYELRTIDGTLEIRLTGEHPSTWHASFDDGRVGLHRGPASSPEATVTMADETFHALLRGDLRYATAQMTGKVRFRGDGEYTFFPGALVQRFREMGQSEGLRGLPGRAFARLVHRTMGNGHGTDGG